MLRERPPRPTAGAPHAHPDADRIALRQEGFRRPHPERYDLDPALHQREQVTGTDCQTSDRESSEWARFVSPPTLPTGWRAQGESVGRKQDHSRKRSGATMPEDSWCNGPSSRHSLRCLSSSCRSPLREWKSPADPGRNLIPGACLWRGVRREISLRKKLSSQDGTSFDVALWPTSAKGAKQCWRHQSVKIRPR